MQANSRRVQRYLPLLSIAAILFLALAVLPSALTLPQPNTSTTLEYAPVPPQDRESQPPAGGNLSSLGLAISGSLGIAGDGERVGIGSGGASGAGKNPSTKRCVGRPPRQTEDPLAPPCVAYFNGDNFGATYAGMTRDEIRIVYYHECWIANITSTGVEQPHCGDTWDLAQPQDPSHDHFAARTLSALQRYFNERYQTYNRFVHFYLVFAQDDTSVEQRRADAAQHYADYKPFAVMSYTTNGNEEAYLEHMAKKGVLNFGSDQGRDESFFQKYPKLIWGYPPSLQVQAKQYASWVCDKVVLYSASNSGNPLENGKPRRLGLLWTNNPNFENYRTFAKTVKQQVEGCGGKFAAEQTFSRVSYAVSNTEYSTAAANMAAFKQAGVTTIIWPQGYETLHSKAGAQIDYRPEWVVAGDGAHDGYNAGSYQDQSAWQRAWVLTNEVLQPATLETQCARAVREGDPNVPQQDVSAACSLRTFYSEMRQLFTGIQVAGPRLNPDSIDKGFHAIPAIPSTNPQVPACFYYPNDYTCVKDAVPMWWDPNKTAPGASAPGCWRMPEGGRRYVADHWAAGDITAQKDPRKDPCNAFGGTFFA